ncbi:cytochrome P450 [Streptomyces sp. NPDC056672]|uniref:cytochrome P450 n=1 Tax=Streptomyces sp. NPDC056672 TaxID=3345906 RepID=UPI003693A128
MADIVPAYPMERAARCPFDPPPALNEREPVSRVKIWDGSTPWLVTGYHEQRAVLAEPTISSDWTRTGYPHRKATDAVSTNSSRAFPRMDNPEHDVHRRMLTSNFMVKRVEALRPRIQQIVDSQLDQMLAGPKPADLVTAFALPVPSLVICELLGVPYADHEFFQSRSYNLLSRTATPEQARAAAGQLQEYLLELVDAKNAAPGDDLFSRLVVERLRTGELSRGEVATMGVTLLVAGHETTANMIALGTVALLQNPGQLRELRETDDPVVVAGAVEELLRYLTIVHAGTRRVATEDIEIGGKLIKAGEGVIVANDAGNRDGTAFPDPDVLDIHRQSRHHVAFGYGIHQCLGQPLARVELQVVYSTLYRRIPTLDLAIPFEEVPFKEDMTVYGVHSLPVTW